MGEDLVHLGELLRAKRKEQQLSLKEIENSTSIRSSYLEAIEDGQIHQYISGVYALGFIRQYALFLGLDMESVIRENPGAFRMPAEKHDFSYGIGTLEMRSGMGSGVKWIPNLLWAVAAGAVLTAAWYLAKFLGLL